MSETISHTWQTVEQAAVTLNVSTRTIARRLSNGTLESRVDDNGRRLVLVQVLTPAETMSDAETESNALSHGSTPPTSVLISNPSDVTAPMLAVLQTTINTLQTESKRSRSAAQWAWMGVGVMGMGVLAVAVLLTSSLTKSSMLEKTIVQTKTELRQTQSELTKLSTEKALAEREKEVAAVQLSAAARQIEQSNAKLAAVTETALGKRATTRPTLLGRLASMMGDDGR